MNILCLTMASGRCTIVLMMNGTEETQTKARRDFAPASKEADMANFILSPFVLTSSDVAIRAAKSRGTLAITREVNARLGNEFWAISDEHGLIEVALTSEEVDRITMAS